MRVAAVSMVRNEADVIEAFVRHHVALVDELVVVDHNSIDGTAEILRSLAAEGLPVEVRTEESPVQRQNPVLSALAREAVEERGADWVIPLDGDEFVVGDPRTALAGLSEPCLSELRLYAMTPSDPADEPNVLRRISHRVVADPTLWRRKVVVPAESVRDPSFSLVYGSHALAEPGSLGCLPAPDGPLALAHFPVRSSAQLTRKVLGAWPATLARTDWTEYDCWQWKRAFDAIAAGGEPDAETLAAIARDYGAEEPGEPAELVHDPVPATFELRYPPPEPPSPLRILASTAEALAVELRTALQREPVAW